MLLEVGKIWMDGKFIECEDANIHVLTHTLHYGMGIFEGIRCYNTDKGPAIFRLQEHIDRLFNSAHIIRLSIPYTREEITKAIIDTVKINKLQECYIRPIVYIGFGHMGLYVKENPINVAVAAWPWGTYLGEEGLQKGVNVKISSFTRYPVNISMLKAKVTANYFNSQLAKKEAVDDGYDEALLLDNEGFVAEGPGENIFIIKNKVIKTTPIATVLEGITRDAIIKIARNLDLQVEETRFTRDELYIADEAFFTGTAAEVTPIREVDRRTIGIGKRGPLTEKLQQDFFDIARGRKSKNFEGWLTFI
ncbi:MAG: branched-chain amino acid transaminase [bacterium]